ncbi:MAG: hypothetical protein WBP84_07140 [Nitrososphaeraceae archaeon]
MNNPFGIEAGGSWLADEFNFRWVFYVVLDYYFRIAFLLYIDGIIRRPFYG